MKAFFLLLLIVPAVCFGQQTDKSLKNDFNEEMKKLVELNSHTENLINLSGKEAINIYENANVNQVIQITAPYINSKTTNSRKLSLFLLFHIFPKAKTLTERQQIVEIICQNYLSGNDIQILDNFLAFLSEKDFNNSAKKEVEKLIYSNFKLDAALKAKWLSYAQIKEASPILWQTVKKNPQFFEQSDLTILASLARLGEKKAGVQICNYYKSTINRTDYRYVFTAKQIAFSLDKTVLQCLVDDYKTMDINWKYRDGDTGFIPSQILGGAITEMIKNYPYKKGEYNINAKQLLDWLNRNNHYELNEK